MKIVIDTNILFSALLKKNSIYFKIIKSGKYDFYICEFNIVELFKHKEKIYKNTELDIKEVLEVYHAILRRVNIFNEDDLPEDIINKADKLCNKKDENDTIFVALSMFLKAKFWTGDNIREILLESGFKDVVSTKELLL